LTGPQRPRVHDWAGLVQTKTVDERKVATVLFADLVGSTELGGSQDPERTRALLERFYEAMASEISAAGGTVEKFAGDAVMAAFGAPDAYEDHAERALHAALSMRRQLETLFAEQLIVRIGVNTGDVMVGRPREGSSFVTGDAVNVAARLEQAAAPGEILVGERTVAASRGAFEFTEPMTVEAKGKPGGVPCRRLIRSLSLSRPRGIPGLGRAFVGRDTEFERLLLAYRRTVEEGRPRLVTIVGDAGVGKTRLVRELWERLADEHPPPLRRTGRCLPYGRGITYWPLGEMLREHLGILESDSPAVVQGRLGDREILGLTLGLDIAGDLHPLAARDRLHDAWVAFLNSLVAQVPLVALIEDLHWAEPPLLDLIEQLARDVEGPLLLVGTARPDFIDARAGWGTGRYQAETIWLEPLSPASAGELIDSVLGAALPEVARRILVQRAEGNPLFIEEMLASLIDRGLIERNGGAWSVGELPSEIEIPDTVQAVVAARLDLLGPSEKGALQAAAVVGRIFWTGPIYDLIEDQPDLRILEDRDFIRRRGGSSLEGEREYAFKHAITREVAYESVPKAKRARLHAAFAEWIDRRIGPRDEVAPLLAHHYAAAVDPKAADLAWSEDATRLDELRLQAIRWLRRAGDLAMSRYELDDASALFRQAIQIGPERVDEVELWRSLGHVAALRYDGEGLWDAMQRAIDRCEEPGVLGELYAELAFETAGRAGMWMQFPDPDLVGGWIEHALELAEPGTLARAQALIALCYWQEDRPQWALDEAEELTERLGDPALRIHACEARWLSEFATGRYQDAVRSAQTALELEQRISDPNASTRMREGMAALFTMCGRLPEARRIIEVHDELSRRLFPHQRLHAVALEIEFLELLGEWKAIRATASRLRTAVHESVATPCVRGPRSLLVCAAACASLGEDHEAASLEREADEVRMEGFGWIIDTPRIRLALHRHDLTTVNRLISASTSFNWRRGAWYFPAAVATHLDALAALGDAERLEAEAAEFLTADCVLQAFAMRALGILRGDPVLMEEAASRFEDYGFESQAANTRAAI
jgi:class 3 adenylate cyclase/tetratricopeptide (TPR) repeat protein